MSPRTLVISTTYKTRVALEKPCKDRLGTLIGQLKDRLSCAARGFRLRRNLPGASSVNPHSPGIASIRRNPRFSESLVLSWIQVPQDGHCGLIGQPNRQCHPLRGWRKWNQTARSYCWHRFCCDRTQVPAALSDHSGWQPLSRQRTALTRVRL